MKRPQLVSRGSLSRMLQSAADAWKCKDFQRCIETLERASRLDPANATVLLDLGGVYGNRYNYASAEQCFERAFRVAVNKADALAVAVKKSLEFGKSALAEGYFQRAVKQKDAKPETLVRLGEFCERLRRLEPAEELAAKAHRLDGSCAAALLLLARLRRQCGQLTEAETLLRSVVLTAEKQTRVRALYELGGILDRQERYDAAMVTFLEAKTLLRADAARPLRELAIMRSRLRELRMAISENVLQGWFDFGKTLQPAHRIALLCGHPRSGTTLLEQVLDAHPEIVSVEESEIFHDEAFLPLIRSLPEGTSMLEVLESAQHSGLQRARANYFHFVGLLVGRSIDRQFLVDKNPSLTFLVPAIIRILPETHFILALRDPRDVCLSCFMQPIVPIGQVSSAYLSLDTTVDEYVALMEMWETVSSLMKNPFLEVRYEDLVVNLSSVSHRVLDFLSVPWDLRVLRFHEHAASRLVRSPTYADVSRPIFRTSVGRWRNYRKHLEPYLPKLQPLARKLGYE